MSMNPPEQKRDLTVPGAILVGSMIVGAGLFFGLRGGSRGSDAPSAPPPPTVGAAGPGQVVSSQQLAPGMPGVVTAPAQAVAASPPAVFTDELKQKVARQAVEALEAKRKDLVEKCWAPAARQSHAPALAKYSFNVAFDAAGIEIARGISDIRGFERADVGACLREQPLGLRIPPPGVNVMVDVPFTLP